MDSSKVIYERGCRTKTASLCGTPGGRSSQTERQFFHEPSGEMECPNRRIWYFFANRLRKWSVRTDGFGFFLRTVWENGASKQTEWNFFVNPSEKKAQANRRDGNFCSIRPKNEKKNTDGRSIFLQTVGKSRRKSQTEEHFFHEPSEK
jgi:hypothetical protein